MSYDFRLFLPQPGVVPFVTGRTEADEETEDINSGPPVPAKEARKRAIADALMKADPVLEVFQFGLKEIERVRELLRRDADLEDDYFLVYNGDLDYWFVCCWSRTNGMMTKTIDDAPLAHAVVEFMKNNGYLQFGSSDEASAHIRARGWVCSPEWPGKRAEPGAAADGGDMLAFPGS